MVSTYSQRTILVLTGFLLLITVVSGCQPEFDISGKKKMKTVVYGLLDPKDTAQYLKITRTFKAENRGATQVAGLSDSLYHDSLQVILEAWDQQRRQERFVLRRINGNKEDHEMEEGLLATSPNILYKTTHPLDRSYVYKLIIHNPVNGKTMTARTPLVKEMKIKYPKKGIIMNFGNYEPPTTTVRWLSAVNGKVYQLEVFFHYIKRNTKTGYQHKKKLRWLQFKKKAAPTADGGKKMEHKLKKEQFYKFVGNRLRADKNIVREPQYLSFHFSVGGGTLYAYMRSNEGQQNSVVANQSTPDYSNIENGKGLLSTRTTATVDSVMLTALSLDSLSCGQHTQHLNFVGPCQ